MEKNQDSVQQLIQMICDRQTILQKILEDTKIQMRCFDADSFDEIRYERIQKRVDEYIIKIEKLNAQFDILSQDSRVQVEEVIRKQDVVAEQLHRELQRQSELAKEVQQVQNSIRSLMEEYLARERKEIKNKRAQRKSAANYYKTMIKQYNDTSIFYDRSN